MPKTPATIGKYSIIEPFGPQCVGPRYKASDTTSGDLVLIRLFDRFGELDYAAQERFFQQAAMEVELRHPNIVAVRDIGQYKGSPYTVMDSIDCESLDGLLASGREISLMQKLGYIIEVCQALTYIHAKGIVHRNVKAANVLILKNGDVKLCDFVRACIPGENRESSPRELFAGTLTHMPPEQFTGESVDSRADLFSTGVVLYHVLTGFLPFQGDDTSDTIMKILNDPPPPFPECLGKQAAQLQEITFRAIAKDRNLRYQSAEDLACDLREFCGQSARLNGR